MIVRAVVLTLLCFIIIQVEAGGGRLKVISATDAEWGYLNPLRGKLSPGAANLWGDRTKGSATGMLVRFNQGFESPPHIHNITYRGVVIDGLLHNDDPGTDKMWMPTGSFWTQPAGENHITAAKGETNLIYLEIDSGPYLVKPTKQAFDNGERAINFHVDNLVWSGEKELHHIKSKGVLATFVWRSAANVTGSLVKLPRGFQGEIATEASEFRLIIVSGEVTHSAGDHHHPSLIAGSYIESRGTISHKFKNNSAEHVIIYIRSNSAHRVN